MTRQAQPLALRPQVADSLWCVVRGGHGAGMDVTKIVASSPHILTFDIEKNIGPKIRQLKVLLPGTPLFGCPLSAAMDLGGTGCRSSHRCPSCPRACSLTDRRRPFPPLPPDSLPACLLQALTW